MIKKVSENILKNIERLQNGDISTAMERMGISYGINYGVSIPQLQQIATQYDKDNNLAFNLFDKNIRETKIISSMLFDTELLLSVELIKISEDIDNIELVEQFSKNIFSKSKKLIKILPILIDGTTWQKIISIYSISWGIKNSLEIQEYLITFGIEQLKKLDDTENVFIQKAFNFMLQNIAQIDDTYYSKMMELVDSIKNENEIKKKIYKEFNFIHRR
jgi:3-methyladenine DNA glycosylase AlkD